MNRLIKMLMLAVAGIIVLVIVAAAALLLLFDPNDFRERISAEVQKATGRELRIEGDLSVSLFPWLAVEMGRTRLGNAEGFGDVPFASFESARLNVRLFPLLLRREVTIGKAELEALKLELAVNASGVSNWDDLTGTDDAASEDDASAGGPASLDISGIEIRDAFIHYFDAGSKSDYTLRQLSLNTGSIALGEAFDFSATSEFESKTDELDGTLQASGNATLRDGLATLLLQNLVIEGDVNGIAAASTGFEFSADEMQANLDNSTLQPTKIDAKIMGLDAVIDLKSMSWATDVIAQADLNVAQFSPRELAPLLDIELPETADPAALSRVQFTAKTALAADTLSLASLQLTLDDTTLTGEIVLPVGSDAPIRFDLKGDSMNLDRYMAPATEAGAAGASASADDDFEIPVELIRSINARGKLQLQEAQLSGMKFTNIQLGLTSGNGKLRISPLSAELFDGNYNGDVQVDASGKLPALSMNEKVADVNLQPLGVAMFERDQLSGTISGSFVLKASGATLSAMRRNLNGTIAFELADGAWQGVDLWYQLRSARALYRREEPPTKREPSRTEFSSVIATGIVTDGVFVNNDLRADLPFLQLTGGGQVDFVSAEMDYSLRARVLERPEFQKDATEEELAEFTEALIPVRVRGPISSPSVRPDIEAMFRDQVEDKLKEKSDDLKKRLLDRLVPSTPASEAPAAGEEGAATDAAPAEEELSTEEQLKKKLLKKLFD